LPAWTLHREFYCRHRSTLSAISSPMRTIISWTTQARVLV